LIWSVAAFVEPSSAVNDVVVVSSDAADLMPSAVSAPPAATDAAVTSPAPFATLPRRFLTRLMPPLALFEKLFPNSAPAAVPACDPAWFRSRWMPRCRPCVVGTRAMYAVARGAPGIRHHPNHFFA
jgi:hypothetical protein